MHCSIFLTIKFLNRSIKAGSVHSAKSHTLHDAPLSPLEPLF